MNPYIVYNTAGKILRTGSCPASMLEMQAHPGEKVIEGRANDYYQKMVGDKVVDKTPEEIEADNPTPAPIPDEDKPARITNKDLAALMQRVKDLEDR